MNRVGLLAALLLVCFSASAKAASFKEREYKCTQVREVRAIEGKHIAVILAGTIGSNLFYVQAVIPEDNKKLLATIGRAAKSGSQITIVIERIDGSHTVLSASRCGSQSDEGTEVYLSPEQVEDLKREIERIAGAPFAR